MYQAAVAVQILSAVVWLGGMLFLLLVMIPIARGEMRSGGTGQGLEVLRDAAERFLPVAWTAMFLLAISRVYIAWEHYGVRPDTFFSDGSHFLFGSRFMKIIQVKTGLFLFVVILSLLHDFWLGPKIMERLDAARAAGQTLPQSLTRKFVRMVAMVNLSAALTIVVLAVWLIRP